MANRFSVGQGWWAQRAAMSLLLASSWLCVACGASQTSPTPAAAQPTYSSGQVPSTELGTAERELWEAERQVLALLEPEAAHRAVVADEMGVEEAAAPSAPRDDGSVPARKKEALPPPAAAAPAPSAPLPETEKVEDRCQVGCRALGSMRRASAAICRLTSDAAHRCQDARARVRNAEQRLASGPCACSPE